MLLALCVAAFELSEVDLALQDRFYDPGAHRWLVDQEEPAGRAAFYHGPKALVWMIGLATIALVAGPERWRRSFERRGLCAAVLTIASVPALAGLGKKLSDVHCPMELTRYGGTQTYRKLLGPRPTSAPPSERGLCFPAGHASGGFALIGLYGARRSRRWRRGSVALGLGLGWWMGGYQMLKGAHFLSHTVVTMLLAWLVTLVWLYVLRVPRAAPPESAGQHPGTM